MEVLKRLAPNYWLGYYAVYVVVFTYLAVVFRDSLAKWPELESLFTAAAIFAVSTGAALLAAVIMEGVGYMVLLIPKRVKELKEAGRKVGFQEGFRAGEEKRKEGRAEALKEGFDEGFRAARAGRKPQPDDEEPASLDGLIAWYHSGGITRDELDAILATRYNGKREAD